MKFNERWKELKEESYANIQSELDILKRQTSSIQTEGHFGDIKGNKIEKYEGKNSRKQLQKKGVRKE